MKLSSNLSDKELRQEIYKLRRELRVDIGEIKREIKTDKTIPTYAVNDFKEAEKSMRAKSVRSMGRKDLVSTYRNLTYIRNLKSSTLEGARDVIDSLETVKNRIKLMGDVNQPLSNLLEQSSKSTTEKFWDIFKRTFDGRADLRERYKYEIWNSIADYMEQGGTNNEEFSSMVEALYDKVLDNEYTDISFEEYDEKSDTMMFLNEGVQNGEIQFTDELRKLFSNN